MRTVIEDILWILYINSLVTEETRKSLIKQAKIEAEKEA